VRSFFRGLSSDEDVRRTRPPLPEPSEESIERVTVRDKIAMVSSRHRRRRSV